MRLPWAFAVLIVLLVAAPGDAEAQSLACDKWENGCDAPWYCFLSENLDAGCTPDDIWDAIFYENWVLYVTGGLVALYLLTVAYAIFPAFKVDGKEIESGFHEFRLEQRQGTVVEKFDDTWIDIRTRTSVNGYGVLNSSTTVSSGYRTFARVRSEQYGSGVVDVTGFDIADGEVLYSLWAIEDRVITGPHALGNVSTNSFVTFPTRLVNLVRFAREPLLVLIAAEIVALRWIAIATVPVSALVYLLFGAPFTSSRLERLDAHIDQNLLSKARRPRIPR